jgi:hypothetical protein
MAVIVRKDDDLAGLDVDWWLIWNLRGQTTFNDVVVRHHVVGALEQ